jgi:hypothetical protein
MRWPHYLFGSSLAEMREISDLLRRGRGGGPAADFAAAEGLRFR